MSQELVAAITSAALDPSTAIERHRAQMAAVDMSKLDLANRAGPLPTDGGAMVQPQPAASVTEPTGPMNLPTLAGKFSEGLQKGFYAEDMGRLVNKIKQSNVPNSGVTPGDVTLELLNVQAKMGVADALRSVTTKLSDGLNTVVVKQG